MAGKMQIDVENQRGLFVMHLSGHLGIDSHRELKSACETCLADPGVAEVRLDLKAVESTDMTALGLLLVLRERAHTVNKRVSLTGCAPGAREHLGVADVARFFPIV